MNWSTAAGGRGGDGRKRRRLEGIGRSGGGDGGGKVTRAKGTNSQSFLKILPYISTRG